MRRNVQPTSILAAEEIEPHLGELQAAVFGYIRTRGRATCDEIEIVLKLRHQTASARVNELAAKKMIRDSGKTALTSSGRKAILWEPSTPSDDPQGQLF